MKQRGWLMIGGAAALSLLSMQAVVAHESRGVYGPWGNSGYGSPNMGMPGQPGYGNTYPGDYHHYNGKRSGSHHGPSMGHDLFERLDLSDEQRKSIRKIMRDARSAFRSIQNKLSDARHALYDLLEADKGAKEANKLADEMGDLMADQIKLRTDMRMKINKVLTEDQREEARDMSFFGRGFGGYY